MWKFEEVENRISGKNIISGNNRIGELFEKEGYKKIYFRNGFVLEMYL
ncbi:hypothetical protein M3X99_13345 [Clostridium perfringens]|nr:hypothetical protein [Clostridium perfringens]MDC4251993.1 hypothetical protein [Clostridium perfringens]